MLCYFKFEPNPQCAIFGNKTVDSRLGFLPNAHTEMVAFLTAFLYSDMWAEYKMEFIHSNKALRKKLKRTWTSSGSCFHNTRRTPRITVRTVKRLRVTINRKKLF